MHFITKVSFLYSKYMKIFNLLHQQRIERVAPLSKIWDYNLSTAPQGKALANTEVTSDNLLGHWALLIAFSLLALKLLFNYFKIL
jgi:hypothetical protein